MEECQILYMEPCSAAQQTGENFEFLLATVLNCMESHIKDYCPTVACKLNGFFVVIVIIFSTSISYF